MSRLTCRWKTVIHKSDYYVCNVTLLYSEEGRCGERQGCPVRRLGKGHSFTMRFRMAGEIAL